MAAPVPLADIFPRFSETDWRNAMVRAKRTAASGDESAVLLPRSASAHAIIRPSAGQPWVAFGRVDASSAEDAVASAHAEIEGGATGIDLTTSGSPHPLAARLPRTAVAAVLSGLPNGTTVRIDVDDVALADIAIARKLDLVVAVDSVAAIAVGTSTAVETPRMAALAEREIATATIADGRPWHAGGASDEQELGIALATFVHHLRLVGGKVDVALVADADQFRTIAKFRAMRLLLARIGEVAGLEVTARIHAETAWRSMSAHEPQMNILRATSAAFGAAVGAADSITVLPFDALAGGDVHGRRLARNTQAILAEEAQVFRVADPAAGSGTIEAMTNTLAEVAWARFRGIEAEGGIVHAIRRGGLLRDVAEAREVRLAQVASGQVKMIGGTAHAVDAATSAVFRSDGGTRLVYRRLAEAHEK